MKRNKYHSARAHYSIYKIPKPNGRYRIIEAPNDKLKAEQKELLGHIKRLGFHLILPSIHGVNTGYKDNALAHKDAKEILKIDLVDFYQNCSIEHILKNIQEAPASENNHKLEKLILTYADMLFIGSKDEDDHRTHLPTGAPTSPYLSNIALFLLDKDLINYVKSIDGKYSRYLDDITISFNKELTPKEKDFIHFGCMLRLNKTGWQINTEKTGWLNPNNDAITVTGVDIRNEPKVTGQYIRKNLRPALDQEAGRIIEQLSNLSLKPSDLHDTTVLNKVLSPKVNGQLAYIKSLSESQYNKMMTYFFKRLEKRLHPLGS